MGNRNCNDAIFRELIEGCADAFLVVDQQGVVRYANQAALRFIDQNSEDLIDKPLPGTLTQNDEHELMISKKSGEHLILDVRENSCVWAGQPATIWTMRDITDHRYQQAAKMVEELSLQQIEKWRSLESLAGGIAHQFNNLLMIILGNCSVIKRGLSYDQPKIDRIEYIEKSSIRAIEITNHLLAFAGLGKYEFREINVSDTIEGIKYIFETLTAKKAKMEYNLDHSIPAIFGDEGQLQRMLYEIITNATEAVGRERGIINVTTGTTSHRHLAADENIQSNQLPEGDYVYIQIADNGCGMDESTQLQIFNPLFTTKSSAKGLGLSAALGIARSHKGTISVHTIPNHGTTIEIFLPVANSKTSRQSEDIVQVAESIINTASTSSYSRNSKGGRILIAEDESYMRELLQEALENSGYRVTTSEDGQDCLDKFDTSPQAFDCVILDMMMPNLDGEETLVEIRKRGSKVPVIITSGFTRESTIAELRSIGVKFLQKPYKLIDLMILVQDTLTPESQKV